MKKPWLRICSLMLVIVMTVNSLPLNAMAEQNQNDDPSSAVQNNAEQVKLQADEEYSNSKIVQENIDGRTEFIKEYLMDSGINMAVVYDYPVHYEKDGIWKEIDNTLKVNSDNTFTNTDGVWEVSFPQTISGSNQVRITKDGYTLSFGMAGELRIQGNLEIMSEKEPLSDIQSTEIKPADNSSKETIAEEKEPDIFTEEPSAITESVEAVTDAATTPTDTAPAATELEETIPEATVPEETIPNEAVPEEATPEETVTEETVPETTVPEETKSETTIPEEAIPEVTDPKETIPEATVPEGTVSIVDTATEALPLEPTRSITIDGKTQIFGVSEAKISTGQIQKLDFKAVLEASEHKETILEKPVSQLMYKDVYTNTDIRYDLVGNQVKESVIMQSYDSKLRGYQFALNTGELVPVLEDDGHIDLYDPSGKTIVMAMPAPYLEDNEFEHSDDVRVLLSGDNGQYMLTYILPQQWLADEERSWPVILDPVVTASLNAYNIQDVTVGSIKSYAYNHGVLENGVCLKNGIQHFYIKYVTIPTLSSSDVILDAKLRLYKPENSSKYKTVEVHKVNSTWNATSITWSNKPGYDPIIEDYVRVYPLGFYTWDVTDIVRGWYAGENTGMMFKSPDSVEATPSIADWVQFYSADFGTSPYRPNLWIYFRNNNGLENYWDYTSSSAGRAGTGHINQYSGNLVWVHDDIGFGGNRMPVSISHIYNANDKATTTFGVGAGWRTNFNQRVYQWSSNTNYYIWEDADGTKHYFLKESTGIYKDEDGLELTLTNTGSGASKFCITDKNGNKSYFDTYGRLRKQENNQATKSSIGITYTTTSGYLIQTITDGAGRKYNFSYSNSLLNKISYVGTGTSEIAAVSYGYSSGKLTAVTYKDGKNTAFTYDANNLLASATDIDGYKLSIEYNTTAANQPNRVSKVSEFDGSVAGGVLNLEYAHNQTTLKDHNGNIQIIQFNNMGNTVSIQDGEGHAQYAKYAKNNSDGTGKGNQLIASSKLQNTVSNLLTDSSFESGTLWSAASGSRSIANSGYLGSKSLAVTGGRVNSSTFSIGAGESCTFSAYVKTTTSGGSLALYADGSAVTTQTFPACSNWTRVEVNYTNSSTSSKTLSAAVQCASGQTVYMDCAQVEKAPTASRYNLIQNGDFLLSGSPAQNWTGTGLQSTDARASVSASAAPQLNTYAMKMVGDPASAKKISQTVPVSGAAGDTYVVAGWALADSVPLNTESQAREFGIRLIFNNTDGTKTTEVAQFNCDTNSEVNWQYSAAAAVSQKAYSSITVEAAYDYNANTVYFDGIQLYKEQFSSSYTYDDDGNVTSVVDLQKQETKYEYTNNNLTKEILPTGAQLTYAYDSYHNVTQATTDTGVVYKFTYDTYGNNTAVEIVSGSTSIKSSATYSADGNRMVSAMDAAGKTTTYNYNANTNVLEWVKYPEDTDATRTNYTYDNMYRMATAAATTDTGLALSANYTYTDDMLTAIQTGSTTYTFGYGNFALRSNVKIGSRTLASYTYTSRNNYLDTLAYGNSDSVKYTYDKQGRVTKQTYEDGATVTYRYDNDGALATVTDSATGRTTTYYYDFIDRMMKYVETGSGYSHSVGYEYDTINNLTKMVETINGTVYNTAYTYDDDNRVTSVSADNAKRNYTYDAFGRVSQQTTKHSSTTVKTDAYTFKAPSGTATSAQIQQHSVDTADYDRSFAYTYDDNGNILTISDGTNTTSYVYDSANQLVRENNQAGGFTHTWTYDNAGNIQSRKEYAYTTGTLGTAADTVNYTYGDNSWGDLLMAYDGQAITYDGIGNPLNDGTRTYTWQHGRQLASMSDGTKTWNFTYNADGLRTRRTDGTNTYEYVYNGDKLSQMTIDNAGTVHILRFTYDAAGTPLSLTVAQDGSSSTYYYVTNIQGDVVALLNSAGNMVVEYSYDAWGNILSIDGSMKDGLGIRNPLRYRGYVYDQEYGFYYLQSRYYNPEVGRFLNADAFTATGQGILGNNMFAYCNSNPVMYSDPKGTELVLDKRTMFGVSGGVVSASPLDAIISMCVAATTVIDTYRNNVKAKVDAKTEKTYQPDKHDHHIVPKRAKKAAPARAILNEIYPEMGVEAPINKVLLDVKIHQFVHTNLYYGMVNYAMITAYYAPAENKLQQEQNVNTALLLLRGLLLVIEKTV